MKEEVVLKQILNSIFRWNEGIVFTGDICKGCIKYIWTKALGIKRYNEGYRDELENRGVGYGVIGIEGKVIMVRYWEGDRSKERLINSGYRCYDSKKDLIVL